MNILYKRSLKNLVCGTFGPVKTTLLCLSMLALLTSCLPNMGKSALDFVEKSTPAIKPDGIGVEVTFEELKEKVLTPKCIGCHKHAAWNDEFEFQKEYIKFGKPEESKLFDSVKMARMPKGKKLPDGSREKVDPLNTAELELVYNYILKAKKLTAFDNLKNKVLASKCLACHQKRMGDEESFIKNYVTPGEPDKSKAYDSVVKQRMPKSPKAEDGSQPPVVPLDEKEIKLLKDYILSLKPQ